MFMNVCDKESLNKGSRGIAQWMLPLSTYLLRHFGSEPEDISWLKP